MINCKYVDICKSYPKHKADREFSKCTTCENNTYIDPENLKKDYYKPNKTERINNLIISLLCCVIGIIFTLVLFLV